MILDTHALSAVANAQTEAVAELARAQLIARPETATCYAEIRSELKRAGTPIPSNDAWIAALCRQHGLPVLSRDRHFDCVTGIRHRTW